MDVLGVEVVGVREVLEGGGIAVLLPLSVAREVVIIPGHLGKEDRCGS